MIQSLILYINSNIVRFLGNNMNILGVDLNNITLDDVNFDENDPIPIICVTYTAWRNRFKQHKRLKKTTKN